MDRYSLASLSITLPIVSTLLDIADGSVKLHEPSHPWWAVTLFFAVSLIVLFLAWETAPENPVTLLNSSLLSYAGYLFAGVLAATLVRGSLRYRLDVDTVMERLPVAILSVAALIATVNGLARLLRPQKP